MRKFNDTISLKSTQTFNKELKDEIKCLTIYSSSVCQSVCFCVCLFIYQSVSVRRKQQLQAAHIATQKTPTTSFFLLVFSNNVI